MNPTQEQLDNRMKATGQVPVVSATDLITPPRPLSVPQNLPTYTPTPVQIPSSLFALQDAVSTSRNNLTNAIAAEPAATAKARADADAALGIPDLQKKVSEYQALDDTYAAQLSNIASDELKQNITGDLATNYAPLNSAIGSRNTRQNIQKQQNVNILRATNAAASAAATGRLAIAEQWKQYAVEEATAQARANVEAKRLLYEDNKEMFTDAERKEYDALIKAEERKYEEKKAALEQTLSFATVAAQNGAPSDVIARATALSPEDALDLLTPYLSNPNADIERDLLRAQVASTNALAANRGSSGAGGLTDYQSMNAFLGISNKYQADPIVQQAIKGATAVQIAQQVLQNPESATNQLKALYVLVKNLDADSAVREGELALASQTQSYFDTFANSIARIQEGRVVSPKAASELAQATIDLVGAWNLSAENRQKAYISQANVAGVGPQFGQYLGGYNSNFTQQMQQPQAQPFNPSELSNFTFSTDERARAGEVGTGGFISGVKNFFGI